jgi:hypothetical protein
MPIFHKDLSIPSLLLLIRNYFSTLEDTRKPDVKKSLVDVIMSAFAMFHMKYSSLLKFEEERRGETIKHNLETLYGVKESPCDTYMREVIDPLAPIKFRPPFTLIINKLKEHGFLKEYEYLDGYYILSMDATGIFSSKKICCPDCCIKNHDNGKSEFYHQMSTAAIVHPDQKVVFPLAPEAIIKELNAAKNDCELNAIKRLLAHIKEEYPDYKFLVLLDSLSSKAPHIKLLKSLGYSYIIGVKEGDHQYLYEQIQTHICAGTDNEFEYYDAKLKSHRGFRFINNLSLNKSNKDVLVNFLEYWEIDETGEEVVYFTWVTDIFLTKENVFAIMRAGRARWKIENEVFNTTKNLSYYLEHNYGHGKQHLSTIFPMLIMLAFLIDQVQKCCCPVFQEAEKTFTTKVYLWDTMLALFLNFLIKDWQSFYLSIIHGHKVYVLEPNINLDIEQYANSS